MQFESSRQSPLECSADWLLVGLPNQEELPAVLAAVDQALDGTLTRLRERGDLESKLGGLTVLPDVPGLAADRLMVVGLGDVDALDLPRLDKALRTAAREITGTADRAVVVAGWDQWSPQGFAVERIPERIAMAMIVAGQGTGHYRQKADRFPLESLGFNSGHEGDIDPIPAARRGQVLGEAINVCRDLVNRAPNDVFPQSFAEQANVLAQEAGLAIEVLDEQRLEKERMGSMLGVAQGSEQPPRLVILRHNGAETDSPTLAICGKGVTFDSGGLSLKSNDNMLTMKSDMAGAATVMAAMSAIARLQLPINVIGLMGLVENMPSGSAFKLGDVLTARNGTTIEIHNTDAEGRLVLADVLAYAADLGADTMIDLATLTGACVVALGMEVTGVFANRPEIAEQIAAASQACGEDTWPLPMHDSFAEQLKSDVADVKNVGSRWGGAITAAKFLERFVDEVPWAHLDIAGPSFANSSRGDRDSGATGCMVQTLVHLAESMVR